MKSFTLSLILPLLVSAVEDVLPHIRSEAFDNGELGAYPNRTYITEPTSISPQLNILKSDSRCDDGLYTMISLRGDKVELKGQSPMIHDSQGNLVWMNATYGETFGLSVQSYKGQEYLTFWQGDDSVGGHGEGYYFLLDSSYREAYKLSAGNGRPGDLHEFHISKDGTALLTQYLFEEATFGGVGPRSRKGFIWDSVIQEVDIETKKVLFEWHAAEHFNIDESEFPSGGTGRNSKSGYDFFHINSIDKDYLGNYLISSRYYQSLTYINGSTGDILWTLGGKHNSFKDLSGGQATKFGWQHDARWTADHSGVTLFDNGARYGLKPSVESSRGVHIALDLQAMTAEVKNSYVNPRKIISGSQGSMQLLPSGNVLLGFGYNAAWTEFTPEGEPLCDVHIGSQKTFNTGAVQTYKVLKHSWTGRPTTKPAVKSLDGAIYMSWNGATEIANWVLQSSSDGGLEVKSLVDVEMMPKTGFETKANIDCHRWHYVRAIAIDAKGQTLGVSEMVETSCEHETMQQQAEFQLQMDRQQRIRYILQLTIFISCGTVVCGLWRWRIRRRTYSAIQQKLWA
ncbi:uncharacterized protein LY89DRAFT_684698 [Mollisia scopiformis]|uniref:ASST-domain-containing protein n=1 Tax=Mollisia scopiformis TaxID=149040 RepID=A0A194XC56_MOLSC|nr:uncharacterized protein LY89DRAFT_684698 [Mollisia scopiformis]KUJ17741.1 hypothetical protein LY89DRAFT_684698 [Mollisia scopiformis]